MRDWDGVIYANVQVVDGVSKSSKSGVRIWPDDATLRVRMCLSSQLTIPDYGMLKIMCLRKVNFGRLQNKPCNTVGLESFSHKHNDSPGASLFISTVISGVQSGWVPSIYYVPTHT